MQKLEAGVFIKFIIKMKTEIWGTRDIPFYIPDDEERKQFALPYVMRAFYVKSEELHGTIRVALCY